MKKTIAVLFALASAVAFAGKDDLIVSFSTPGTDKYADGTVVKVGECYSLIYTYDADGSYTNVLNYQTKLAGRCSDVVYIVDENTAKSLTGGSWGVYLLDTRDFANGGEPAGLDANGQPKLVNVKVSVASSIAASESFTTPVIEENSVTASLYNLAAEGVPQPTVTGIKIVGANVVVTVANTCPFVGYTLISGSDTKNFSIPAEKGVNGDYSGEIELVTPKTEGAQFFKVSTVK